MARPTKFNEIKTAYKPIKMGSKFGDVMGGDPIYNTSAWRKLSKLKKIITPLCEVNNCYEVVHTVDHIIPIKMGGKLLDMSNLQSLCRHHNFSKTGKQKGQGGVKK
jgi:5-methylcytosine-specific restriction endonuclease McrA